MSSQFSPNILCKVAGSSGREPTLESCQAAESPDMDNPDAILVAPPETRKEVVLMEEFDSDDELILDTSEPDADKSDVDDIPKTTVVEINAMPSNIDDPQI